jgi:hypothetical protein
MAVLFRNPNLPGYPNRTSCYDLVLNAQDIETPLNSSTEAQLLIMNAMERLPNFGLVDAYLGMGAVADCDSVGVLDRVVVVVVVAVVVVQWTASTTRTACSRTASLGSFSVSLYRAHQQAARIGSR